MEGCEVDVITAMFTHAFEQRSIHPVYDGTIHLPGAAEGFLVILEIADENILYL